MTGGPAAFTRGFAGALLVWAVAYPAVTVALVRYPSAGVTAIADVYRTKEGMAARTARRPGRRVFLVAGSSGAHGFDAQLLEARLGLPAVNFGTHAGLGMAYILDRTKRSLRPGDAVVAAFEYHLWWDTPWPFRDVEWKTFATADKRRFLELGLPTALRTVYTLPLRDYPLWIAALAPPRLLGKSRPGYDPTAMGPNGDYRVLPPPADFQRLSPELPPAASGGSFPAFRAFAAWCREHGVALVATWPNVGVESPRAEASFAKAPEAMRRFFEETGTVLLDEPGDSFFPRAWFRDTAYHIAPGGRRLRTERLARLLAPRLGLPPLPDPKSSYVTTPLGGPVTPLDAFGPGASVGVKVLVPERSWPPECATASDLAALAASGEKLLFDDPAVEAALLPYGVSGVEAASATQTPASFLARFPDDVVFAVLAGQPPAGARPPDALPVEVRRAAVAGGRVAAVFATGDRRFPTLVRAAADGARISLDGNEVFPGIGRSRTRVEAVSAASPGAAGSGVIAWGKDVCTGGPGWCLAAFDPVTGLLAGGVTFPFDRPATTARLFQLVPAGKVVREALAPALFLASGTEPPQVATSDDVTVVSFAATNSVWAADVRRLPREGSLELEVACAAGTTLFAVVQTNAPWRFAAVAPPQTVACGAPHAAARTFWRLSPGEALADGEWALVGLSHDGPPASVRVVNGSIRTVRP